MFSCHIDTQLASLSMASMASRLFSTRNKKSLSYNIAISQQTQQVTLHGTREVKTAETHNIMTSRLKEHQPFIFSILSHGWLCFPASLYLLLLRALSVSRMSSFSLAKSLCGILNRHYICTKPGGLICASWVQFTVIHCHVWLGRESINSKRIKLISQQLHFLNQRACTASCWWWCCIHCGN